MPVCCTFKGRQFVFIFVHLPLEQAVPILCVVVLFYFKNKTLLCPLSPPILHLWWGRGRTLSPLLPESLSIEKHPACHANSYCSWESVSASSPIRDRQPSPLSMNPQSSLISADTSPTPTPDTKEQLCFPHERTSPVWPLLSVPRDCMKIGEVDGKKIGCTVSLLVSTWLRFPLPPNPLLVTEALTFVWF